MRWELEMVMTHNSIPHFTFPSDVGMGPRTTSMLGLNPGDQYDYILVRHVSKKEKHFGWQTREVHYHKFMTMFSLQWNVGQYTLKVYTLQQFYVLIYIYIYIY